MTDIRTDMMQQGREAHAFAAGGKGAVEDFWALLKPRVMSLVIFTAICGLLLAPGDIHPWTAFIAILCIAVGAGASGALNMAYDADIDVRMGRTAKRPIPRGAIEPGEAYIFGITLSVGSVVVLGLAVNWVAAAFLAFTIFFYAVIYTAFLKRSTPQNIVIGGAAGAFPPMIAWSAVTGSVDLASVSLFLIIFMWTPPHFWALALFRFGDYETAGVPMLPNVAGVDATRRQIWWYSLALAPVAALPIVSGIAGWVYGAAALALTGKFILHAWAVYALREGAMAERAPKKLFGYSILYLFAIFGSLLVDRAVSLTGLI
ncbi:MAG: heme o synthase [Anderseniella sp.]